MQVVLLPRWDLILKSMTMTLKCNVQHRVNHKMSLDDGQAAQHCMLPGLGIFQDSKISILPKCRSTDVG